MRHNGPLLMGDISKIRFIRWNVKWISSFGSGLIFIS